MSKTRKNRNSNNKTKKNSSRVFKKNDFYSGDGFQTSVWGPIAWTFLHTISFNYPVNPTTQQKHQYRDFILSLQNVLPCATCRKNLTTNLKQLPLTMNEMKNRDSFSRYVYNLHELVNKMLHKKSSLSYCDVRERYEHLRARCSAKLYPNFVKIDLDNRGKEENGCTEPLYGKKARCIISIVPKTNKGQSLQIDKKCIKSREPNK